MLRRKITLRQANGRSVGQAVPARIQDAYPLEWDRLFTPFCLLGRGSAVGASIQLE
jgi:hypothetical protein